MNDDVYRLRPDSTRLGRELAQMERDDPEVGAAAAALDRESWLTASGHRAFVRDLYADSRGDEAGA